MAKCALFMLLIVVILAGCARPSYSEPSGETTERQDGYSFPDELYEYCGEQQKSDEALGFDLYCFNDFETMASCKYDTEQQDREYSDCNFDAHINVKIDRNQADDPLEILLTNLIVEKNPSTVVLHNAPETLLTNLLRESQSSTNVLLNSVQKNPNEIILAEVFFAEDKTLPTLLTMLRTNKDTVVTIEGKASNSYETLKFDEAFKVFVSSIITGNVPQIGTHIPEY